MHRVRGEGETEVFAIRQLLSRGLIAIHRSSIHARDERMSRRIAVHVFKWIVNESRPVRVNRRE